MAFVDIFPNVAAYEDRRTPSFSDLLIAKGLARYQNNSVITTWYNAECTKLVDPTAVASLRWVDIHQLLMPVICFAADATGISQSCSRNFVVGNVMAVQAPILIGTGADVASKQVSASVPLPSTTADHLHREKMERINSWLKQEANERWRHVAAQKCMETSKAAAVDVDTRPGNKRQEAKTSQAENKLYVVVDRDVKVSSCTSVPLQSHVVTSSVASNPQKSGLPRSRPEMDDMPEKDVKRDDPTQHNCTGFSGKSCSVEEFMNLQSSDHGQVQKSSASKNELSGGRSKTRLLFGDGHEKPLFLLDDSACCERRSSPGGKKANSPESRNSVTPKPGGISPKFCTSEVLQLPRAKMSPLSAKTEIKSDLLPSRSHNKENAVVTSPKKCPSNDDAQLTRPLIPPPSFFAAATNTSPCLDINEEEDVHSECSATMAEMRVVESDCYLTANESSSSTSVTPQKKDASISVALPAVPLSPVISCRGSSPPTDEETVCAAVAGEDAKVALQVAPVKLEIPESRCVTVLVSEIESPDRFWVNVASAECAQVDRVTEVLNSNPSSLKPADVTSGSIELHQCYCVRSDKDGLWYRAEVVEICYGDARCKRSSLDAGATCHCDRFMRSSATDAKAVKVRSPSHMLVECLISHKVVWQHI